MKLLTIIVILSLYSFGFEATYYGKAFQGNYTYSGEVFDMNGMTCASNVFRMGLNLKITNIENGKSVIVRVNDCGKMKNNVIDLSEGAFKKIAKLSAGRIKVRVFPILNKKDYICKRLCRT